LAEDLAQFLEAEDHPEDEESGQEDHPPGGEVVAGAVHHATQADLVQGQAQTQKGQGGLRGDGIVELLNELQIVPSNAIDGHGQLNYIWT